MTPILIGTHLVAFAAGCVLTHFVTVRYVRVASVDGQRALGLTEPGDHMTARETLRRSKLTVVLLVAAIVVIAIGVQAKLAADDNAQRDARQHAYTLCLSKFAGDLVRNLDQRSHASAQLEKADRDKNQALDELIVISAQAQDYLATHPNLTRQDQLPPKLLASYVHTLRWRVQTQTTYNRVYEHVQQVRAHNPYVPPRAICS